MFYMFCEFICFVFCVLLYVLCVIIEDEMCTIHS